MTPKARCFSIASHAKFYDTRLPVEGIDVALFKNASFRNVGRKAIRKGNSKKGLFEYIVRALVSWQLAISNPSSL